MTDRDGVLLVTGGSGTVGTVLLPSVAGRFRRIAAVGRVRPTALREADTFIEADFAVPSDVDTACARIPGPVVGVVLAAGVDSRAGLVELTDTEFQTCMRVNCLSGLRLLAAVMHRSDVRPLPVVVISSDVVGDSLSDTVTYAASKAALEEGVRHAVADTPGLSVLLMRLPDLGVPMIRTDGSRPRPASATGSAVLQSAVERVAQFLADPPPPRTVEVWPHA